jgi:hypothetical protein
MLSVALAALVCVCAPISPAAGADEPMRPRFSVDIGVVGGAEPLHYGDLTETAVLVGGDVRLRAGVVSVGMRLETRTELTRVLGTLGFNIGLGERTGLSPYLGFGSSIGTGFNHPDKIDARVGLEVEHFLTRSFSIGAGLAFDLGAWSGNELYPSAFSGVCRLGLHLPFG